MNSNNDNPSNPLEDQTYLDEVEKTVSESFNPEVGKEYRKLLSRMTDNADETLSDDKLWQTFQQMIQEDRK